MSDRHDLTGSRRLVRNVLTNWVVLASTVGYTFFITPIVVGALEQERYGVWSFLNGLTAYSGLLYLGLGAAILKYTAVHRANDDRPALNRLASVILSIYTALGLVCLGVLWAVSGSIGGFFAEPLSAEAAEATIVACQLLGGQLFFLFVGSAFAGVLSGHDRFDLVNFIQLSSLAVRVVAVPLLVTPDGAPLKMLAAITVASAAVETLILTIVLFATVPDLRVRFTLPRFSELKLLYGFGLYSFVILFASKLISYTDTTVIGVMVSASAVTLYALPLQLVENARLAINGVAGVLLPRLTTMVERGDLAHLRRAYLDAIRVSSSLTGWLAAGMMFLGPAFLTRWVGPDVGGASQWVIIFLAAALFTQVISSQVPLAFYQALHIVAFPAAVLMVEALINLGLSIWLAPRMGIDGVALATVIPAFLISGAILPLYLGRHLDYPLARLIGKGIMPGLLMLGATGVVLWWSGTLIDSSTYGGIFLRALLSAPVALAVAWWTFPAEQLRALAVTLGLVSRP
jgi:O-antigen/teichoic acid export membrane protein